MIYSSIRTNDDTAKYPAALRRAIAYLKNPDLAAAAPGEYPLEGDKMYVKIFDTTSKPLPETRPEYHNDYIDVQFCVTGGELMGISHRKEGYAVVEELANQDCWLIGDAEIEGEQFLHLLPGDYIILFPNDVHRPGVAENEPQTYRKAVVKIHKELMRI